MRYPPLFERTTAGFMRERIRRLRPATPALWGRMTSHEVFCHLYDQLRLALGETEPRPARGLYAVPLVRTLVLQFVEIPKGRLEAPAILRLTKPEHYIDDRERLELALDRCVQRGATERWGEHPKFGPMSKAEWGVLSLRHFDHHMQQFGV